MAHDNNHDNVKEIWYIFGLLSLITIVEVILGIIKPEWSMIPVLGYKILNWIFVGLTLLKAYYIVWYFMHAKHEASGFRRSFVWSFMIFGGYAVFIFLAEGSYVHQVLSHIVFAFK